MTSVHPTRQDAGLDDAEVARTVEYWNAANYLTVAQIYLRDNPLLRRPLTAADIKPRLLGHWGTSPGQNLVYVQLNRLIREHDLDVIYIAGPGHGGPAVVANVYLEGTYSEIYSEVSQDEAGLLRLMRQFSTPGGIPSHVSVTTPGSIHEGGELGYALVHAFGAVFDNPNLIAACVIGDGEAETGPLSGSWKGIRFLNPVRDGAVIPILHLNGYKISGPTVSGRTLPSNLAAELGAHGYDVLVVEGSDPMRVHREMAIALESAYERIRDIQQRARSAGAVSGVPRWPAIVLRTPKGWTCPATVDGVPIEGTFRAHQVPVPDVVSNPEHLAILEAWMRSYAPERLFDASGRLRSDLAQLAPTGRRRMGANPAANGGLIRTPLRIRPLETYAVAVAEPGAELQESTRRLGEMIRDIYIDNPTAFRLFCPDETNSNRLGAVFEASNRCLVGEDRESDDHVSADGRVMEVLSEHLCEGWLEGYLLTGRHGMFATYEAFAMVSASMAVQHTKWLEHGRTLPWREQVASLNILLTSTCWRNDHNGFSHQGPGLIDSMISMSGNVVRVYVPADANTLLQVADHCFQTTDTVNLIVIDKQPELQWLSLEAAREHFRAGASRWDWAGTGDQDNPDIVLASAGDVPTLETLAAAALLRRHLPDLNLRVVNVVDLMCLPPEEEHPHGLAEAAFAELFTRDRDVVFAFHGYARALHQLLHGRPGAGRFHVRGFSEQGTTTTPFDMTVLNEMSRYHLVLEALHRLGGRGAGTDELTAFCNRQLQRHHHYIREHLEDMPEVRDWRWPQA